MTDWRTWLHGDKWPNYRGGTRQRVSDAWCCITGRWSLHRAYQAGLDDGSSREYERLIKNGAWRAEIGPTQPNPLQDAIDKARGGPAPTTKRGYA